MQTDFSKPSSCEKRCSCMRMVICSLAVVLLIAACGIISSAHSVAADAQRTEVNRLTAIVYHHTQLWNVCHNKDRVVPVEHEKENYKMCFETEEAISELTPARISERGARAWWGNMSHELSPFRVWDAVCPEQSNCHRHVQMVLDIATANSLLFYAGFLLMLYLVTVNCIRPYFETRRKDADANTMAKMTDALTSMAVGKGMPVASAETYHHDVEQPFVATGKGRKLGGEHKND